MNNKQLTFTVLETAEVLGMTKNRVYTLIHSGILKGFKCGRTLVSIYAIENFLKEYAGCDLSNPQNITPLS